MTSTTLLSCSISECLKFLSVQEELEDSAFASRIGSKAFETLWKPQWFASMANFIHDCLYDKMRSSYIPAFVEASRACCTYRDFHLTAGLLEALSVLSSHLASHLRIIVLIKSQADKFVVGNAPCLSLAQLCSLQDTYLKSVSSWLLTVAKVDLQKVRVVSLLKLAIWVLSFLYCCSRLTVSSSTVQTCRHWPLFLQQNLRSSKASQR
jgi:hypothetical protein